MSEGNGKTSEESNHALLERLIKIMGMTTSDNDNTALVAIRRANETLAKLDTDWHRLLTRKVTIIADPFVNLAAQPAPKAPPPSRPPRRPTTGPFAARPGPKP
jgi:hypothetical protein